MKQLDDHTKDTVKIVSEKEVEKGAKLTATHRPHAGHTLFKCDLKNGEVTPEPVIKEIDIHKNTVARVVQKDGFIYTFALNHKNAVKRFTKFLKANVK